MCMIEHPYAINMNLFTYSTKVVFCFKNKIRTFLTLILKYTNVIYLSSVDYIISQGSAVCIMVLRDCV